MAATAFRRAPSVTGSLAPSYTTNDIELVRLDDATPTASLHGGDLDDLDDDQAPPPYGDSGAFNPTVHLQIQTAGKRLLSLPVPPRPEPIPIHRVDAATGEVEAAPTYLSLRQSRGSGNCTLVQASDPAQTPLSSTTYRFGPGRPPQVQLFDPSSPPPASSAPSSSSAAAAAAAAADETPSAYDIFPIESRGLLTRAQKLKTRLGAFEWRYATRKERKAAGADSLLVLDRVVRVFRAGGAAEEEQRTPVARLVRSAGLRSPGSSPSSAGNGGRLLIDLTSWSGDDAAKRDREMAEVLVVTTCVSMLKKEVDRRRAQQMAVMMAAASGGGGP